MPTRIGLDLDNTLASYDALFWELAVEQKLIAAEGERTKQRVKRELIESGNEEAWTELQGLGYGPRMSGAVPYDGALRFVRRAEELGVQVSIISHRSRYPYRGPSYDLHAAAMEWLDQYGLVAAPPGDGPARVYLEETRALKLARVAALGCEVFVDDLIAVLTDPGMPKTVETYLFDPSGSARERQDLARVESWGELEDVLLSTDEVSDS